MRAWEEPVDCENVCFYVLHISKVLDPGEPLSALCFVKKQRILKQNVAYMPKNYTFSFVPFLNNRKKTKNRNISEI